jgi:hypothetical protein
MRVVALQRFARTLFVRALRLRFAQDDICGDTYAVSLHDILGGANEFPLTMTSVEIAYTFLLLMTSVLW